MEKWIVAAALLVVVAAAAIVVYSGGLGGNAPPAQTPTPIPATATPFQTSTPAPTATPAPTPTPEPTQALASPTPFSPFSPEDITALEVSTDKEFYHVGEQMTVTVSITSSESMPAAVISLQGITSSRGYNYVSRQDVVDLPQGMSQHNYTFTMPSCSPCSGLSYGNHSFTVTLSQNGVRLKNASRTIEIRQA